MFDFIAGTANFAVTRRLVDVDLDGDGDAAPARSSTTRPADDRAERARRDDRRERDRAERDGRRARRGDPERAGGAGDTRSWTAVTGKDIGVTLDVPGISASVVEGSVLAQPARV